MLDLFEPWVTKATLVVSLLAGANAWLYTLKLRLDREYQEGVQPRSSSTAYRDIATCQPAMAGREVELPRAAA